MPTICRFFGIVIRIYFDDHPPPHFHAYYSGHEATLRIDTLEIDEGHLPRRALGLIREWAEEHQSELLESWQLAEAHQPLKAIAPLE